MNISSMAKQMNGVARYEVDVIGDVCGPRFEMARHPSGDWVEYEAYAALQQENATLRERLEKAGADAARYSCLQTVTPYRFKKLQDSCIADTGDTLYFLGDKFNNAVDELKRINNIRSAIGGTPEIADLYRRKCVQFVQNATACAWPNCACDHPSKECENEK